MTTTAARHYFGEEGSHWRDFIPTDAKVRCSLCIYAGDQTFIGTEVELMDGRVAFFGSTEGWSGWRLRSWLAEFIARRIDEVNDRT